LASLYGRQNTWAARSALAGRKSKNVLVGQSTPHIIKSSRHILYILQGELVYMDNAWLSLVSY